MTDILLVRAPTAADAAVIVDFNCRLALESEGRALTAEIIAAGVEAVLAGKAECEYFLAEEWSDWRNGWFYWIQSVYIAPEYRRRGVFTRLYQETVARVEARPDTVGLRLYVETHNEQALKTYEKLGMTATGYSVLEHPLRRVLPAIASPNAP
jgi:ribosomal protein S18 acetylase RimI-like enzyme